MGLVKNYVKDGDITDDDYLLGSNGDSNGKTSNYYIRDLKKIFGISPSVGISDVTGLQDALDDKVDDSQVLTDVPANAVFTDTVYTLPFANNSINWNAAYGWGNHSGIYSPLNHTHSTSEVTGLDAILSGKVDKNADIIAGTQIKITYDSKGLVLAGAPATTLDVPDSSDRRYVTDLQKSYIDQDVTIGSSPTFDDLTLTTINGNSVGNHRKKISNYWFDTIGNTDINAIEIGNTFDGWVNNTRYVVGIVIALPFDVDDNTKASLIIDNIL